MNVFREIVIIPVIYRFNKSILLKKILLQYPYLYLFNTDIYMA